MRASSGKVTKPEPLGEAVDPVNEEEPWSTKDIIEELCAPCITQTGGPCTMSEAWGERHRQRRPS